MWPFNLKPVERIVVEPEKMLYVVDVLSTHRCRYVVECTEKQLDALVSFDENTVELVEFSQEHLGDKIVSYHSLKDKDHYLKVFDNDNDYLKTWTEEQKFGLINRK